MRVCSLISALLLLASAGSASMLPKIANSGFEDVAPGNDAPGWGWFTRAAASFRAETRDPHSGSRCLVFKNDSPLAPEIYGRLNQSVPVMPSTRYELSVWVRGEDVAEGLHLTDWATYTLNIPAGTYGWQRASVALKTGDGQTALDLGINVVNKCKALAIDDVSLRPVGSPLKGDGVTGSLLLPGQVAGDKKPMYFGLYLDSSLPEKGRVEAVVTVEGNEILRQSADVKPGENSFDWEWDSGTFTTRTVVCRVNVLDAQGRTVASEVREIEKLSPKVLLADVDLLEKRLVVFDDLASRCRSQGIPLDYPLVARTTVEQFIPLTRQDAEGGEERRANYAIRDMNASLDRAIADMRRYLRDPASAPNAVRYRTGKVSIDGLSFVGDRLDTRGTKSRGPLFFCGYGHFAQVREDMPRWPGYGVNIIQSAEFGPSAVFPDENTVTLDYAKMIARSFDDAARHNIRVDLLLSPHYFPEWAMKKWPHLGKGGGGFLGYCVDEAEAKQVVEKFLRLVVPMFKDKPALHSFCLTNEPLFDRGAGCDNTRAMWDAYLARVHGDVAALNQRYGTNYAGFDAVPIPGNGSYGDPQFYDWCVFNQQRFAGWHRWMADIIHEIAPHVPVHAKAMWIPATWRPAVVMGEDPELFSQLSDINGNDCTIWPGGGYWGISWSEQNMFYDLQRSMGRKPIFNSENHIQHDGSTYYVRPEHYRTALWQGAVHGQGATTIWVWGRANPKVPGSAPFYGSVMDRPGCAEAVGRTCLDLNRFADEVTALQNVRAPVAIVYSMASYAKHDGFLAAMGRAYAALNFLGVKIDFISQKQIVEGKGAQYKMIIAPETVNVPDDVFEALEKAAGKKRLVLVGDSLARDPYGRERPAARVQALRDRCLCMRADSDPEKVLWPAFRAELGALGGLPEVSVVDADTGEPVWGVEWLPAEAGGRTVINIVDLRTKPKVVKVRIQGKDAAVRDLLGPGGSDDVGLLRPITPVLAEVAR